MTATRVVGAGAGATPSAGSREQFDVVVVGARCSGSPLATFLARRGVRVCVLDKARFPSDTASTHIIQPAGVAVLERLGVLGRLADAGVFERVSLLYDDARLEAAYADPLPRSLLSTGARPGLCVRRTVLDAVLLDAARVAGADVRTSTAVRGVLRDRDGRVCGVRTDGGEIGARVVVGADGRASDVAAAVGAREYATYPAGRLAAWGYFAGARPDAGRLRIGRVDEHAYVACPADAGLLTVGVVPSMSGRSAFLADRDRQFRAELQAWPELDAVLEGATRVGPMRVIADWHGFLRESAGPGWVLTGDAGNFKDPSAAQGIADSLRQAERLAGVVAGGLDAGGGLDDNLRRWWRWRDDDCREMHWFAADMGAPGPTRPVTAQVLREVAGDDAAGAHFLRVLNRDLAPSALLTRPRLGRAALHAWRRGAPGRPVVGEVAAAVCNEVRRLPAGRRFSAGRPTAAVRAGR